MLGMAPTKHKHIEASMTSWLLQCSHSCAKRKAVGTDRNLQVLEFSSLCWSVT